MRLKHCWVLFGWLVFLSSPLWALSLPFYPDQATRAWLSTMGSQASIRSDAYFEGGYFITFISAALTIAISFLFVMTGWAAALRSWFEKKVKFYFFVVALMMASYILAFIVLTLPFWFYTDFIREHQFGLATQDFFSWFKETLINIVFGTIFASIVISLFYLLLRKLKNSWWIWGAAAAVALQVLLIFLAPVFIGPMFNTYKAMPEGELRTDILQMAQANGVPADEVYVFDVSRQSNRVTANVSGIWNTTRISLSDTLLARGSKNAVRSVMGHEIGHYVLKHTYSILLMTAMWLVIAFAVTSFILRRLINGTRWKIRELSDPASLPLFIAVTTFVFTVATPVTNNLSCFHEHQADIFGLNAAREPDGFAEATLLVSEYRKMEPGPFEKWFFYDHPSGYDRIHMAMQWKAHEMAAGRYPIGPGGPPQGWHPDFAATPKKL